MNKTKTALVSIFFILFLGGTANAQTIQWVEQFGTSSFDWGAGIASSPTNIYVMGTTLGQFPSNTSAGSSDVFIRSFDLSGNVIWTKQFGTSGFDTGRALSANTTNIFVVGATSGTFSGETPSGGQDAFLSKLDSSGNVLWTKQFGSTGSDDGLSIAITSSELYVGGQAGAAFPGQTYSGSTDAFIRKYDLNGNVIWTKQFGTSGIDLITGVAIDANGVYITGRVGGALPGQIWSGGNDAFIRKYDFNGNEIWTRQFGGGIGVSIATDSTGAYILGQTSFSGSVAGHLSFQANDAFIRKYDSLGNLLWSRQFGSQSGGIETPRSIVADTNSVYVIGETSGIFTGQTSSGSNDVFVRKYASNGTLNWTKQFGTSSNDYGYGAVINSDNVYVAGYTSGVFSGETSAGSDDTFLALITDTTPLDLNPPVTSINLSGALGQNGWYTSNVTVSFNSTSSGGGVYRIYYCVDASNTCNPIGPLNIYSIPFTITNEGTRFVRYLVWDNAGSPVTTQSSGAIKIDKTPPIFTSQPSLPTYVGTSSITLSWVAFDPTFFGPLTYDVYRDSVLIATTSSTSYIDSGLLNGQTYTYRIYARDFAGNTTVSNFTSTTVDLLPPSIPAMNALPAFKNTIPLFIDWTDSVDPTPGSGLNHYNLFRNLAQIASPISSQYSDSSVFHNNTYSYKATAVDNVGNESGQSNTVSTTLDTIAPTTTHAILGVPIGGVYTTTIGIQLTAVDNGPSGLQNTFYRLNAGPFFNYTGTFNLGVGNWSVNYYSIDNAGNQETLKSFNVVVELDSDGDGYSDSVDNCRTVSNPMQENTDSFPGGDACQPQVSILSVSSSAGNINVEAEVTDPNDDIVSGNLTILGAGAGGGTMVYSLQPTWPNPKEFYSLDLSGGTPNLLFTLSSGDVRAFSGNGIWYLDYSTWPTKVFVYNLANETSTEITSLFANPVYPGNYCSGYNNIGRIPNDPDKFVFKYGNDSGCDNTLRTYSISTGATAQLLENGSTPITEDPMPVNLFDDKILLASTTWPQNGFVFDLSDQTKTALGAMDAYNAKLAGTKLVYVVQSMVWPTPSQLYYIDLSGGSPVLIGNVSQLKSATENGVWYTYLPDPSNPMDQRAAVHRFSTGTSTDISNVQVYESVGVIPADPDKFVFKATTNNTFYLYSITSGTSTQILDNSNNPISGQLGQYPLIDDKFVYSEQTPTWPQPGYLFDLSDKTKTSLGAFDLGSYKVAAGAGIATLLQDSYSSDALPKTLNLLLANPALMNGETYTLKVTANDLGQPGESPGELTLEQLFTYNGENNLVFGQSAAQCTESEPLGQEDGFGDPLTDLSACSGSTVNADNCFSVFNPDQRDSERDDNGDPAPDGVGDVCDSCPVSGLSCPSVLVDSGTCGVSGCTLSLNSGFGGVDSVVVPFGAVSEPTSFSVSVFSNPADLPTGFSGLDVGGADSYSPYFVFTPSGVVFSEPVIVTLRFDDVGTFAFFSGLMVYRDDGDGFQPVSDSVCVLDDADNYPSPSSGSCSFSVNGFSVFVIAGPKDSDGDGLFDPSELTPESKRDHCPLTAGSVDRAGCPVADEMLVELHEINQAKLSSVCNGKGSCKSPLSDVEVKVFNRNDSVFQALFSKNPKGTEYMNVFEADAGLLGSCVTAGTGRCVVGEEFTGDYLVVVKFVDLQSGKTVYSGKPKSSSDFVNGVAFKDFQVMKTYLKSGGIDFKGGSKTVVNGSYLEVLQPEYVVWFDSIQVYPFIFTSDSDWSVDVCLYVPQGYRVLEGDCTQVFLAGEAKEVVFTVQETSSPKPDFDASFSLTHKGKTQKVSKKIEGARNGREVNLNSNGQPKLKGKALVNELKRAKGKLSGKLLGGESNLIFGGLIVLLIAYLIYSKKKKAIK